MDLIGSKNERKSETVEAIKYQEACGSTELN